MEYCAPVGYKSAVDANSDDLDRKWADETLRSYDLDDLTELLLGNPSTAWELAVYCNEEHIPRFTAAILRGASAEDHEFAEQLVMAALRGLKFRYDSREIPDTLGIAIVAGVKQLIAIKRR